MHTSASKPFTGSGQRTSNGGKSAAPHRIGSTAPLHPKTHPSSGRLGQGAEQTSAKPTARPSQPSDSEPSIPVQVGLIEKELQTQTYTPDIINQFKQTRGNLDAKVKKTLKYLPQLGSIDTHAKYKPFINAVMNIGGVTHRQLFQLHQYTQCVLATQRHKLDLNALSDGYFINARLPPLPESFPYLNVTSLRVPYLVFNQHIADALSLVPTFEAQIASLKTPRVRQALHNGTAPSQIPVEIVDVGSGGGIPALILAIVRPQWKITAIDSVTKKCLFLRHTADLLGLSNFTVIAGGVQHYTSGQTVAKPIPCYPQYANLAGDALYRPEVNMFEAYDICVARGVTQMPELLPICLPLVTPGGIFVAMKNLLGALPVAASEPRSAAGAVSSGQSALIVGESVQTAMKALAKTLSSSESAVIPHVHAKSGQIGTKGDRFKAEQDNHNQNLTNFDALRTQLLAQPWVPAGQPNAGYEALSLELAEGIPMGPNYGGSSVPSYVHTDLFFLVSAARQSKGKTLGILRTDSDNESEETDALTKYRYPGQKTTPASSTQVQGGRPAGKPTARDQSSDDSEDDNDLDAIIQKKLASKSQSIGSDTNHHQSGGSSSSATATAAAAIGDQFDMSIEGKVGETAKYLCIIPKIKSTNLAKLEKPRVPQIQKPPKAINSAPTSDSRQSKSNSQTTTKSSPLNVKVPDLALHNTSPRSQANASQRLSSSNPADATETFRGTKPSGKAPQTKPGTGGPLPAHALPSRPAVDGPTKTLAHASSKIDAVAKSDQKPALTSILSQFSGNSMHDSDDDIIGPVSDHSGAKGVQQGPHAAAIAPTAHPWAENGQLVDFTHASNVFLWEKRVSKLIQSGKATHALQRALQHEIKRQSNGVDAEQIKSSAKVAAVLRKAAIDPKSAGNQKSTANQDANLTESLLRRGGGGGSGSKNIASGAGVEAQAPQSVVRPSAHDSVTTTLKMKKARPNGPRPDSQQVSPLLGVPRVAAGFTSGVGSTLNAGQQEATNPAQKRKRAGTH